MPLVTLTVRKPKSSAFKSSVLDAVHDSLVGTGVPVADKFQRVIELDADDFALIEVLWSVGRSVNVKKKFLAELMQKLSAAKIDPENVLVVFKETQWENWSFAGGRLIHASG